jgi:hypothetical protein
MKKLLFLIPAGALILFSSCRQNTPEAFLNRLPELPPEIYATLDTQTMATRIPTEVALPQLLPGTAAAPCCAIHDTKTLMVRFAYTRCGPLHDFIVTSFGDFVVSADIDPPGGGQPGPDPSAFQAYKLRSLKRGSILDHLVCVTSDGPWPATLIEDRFCTNYTPRYTLIINAFSDLVSFTWTGAVGNHPPQVQLVSCRQVSTLHTSCGGLSTCQCTSTVCPPTQACECTLAW